MDKISNVYIKILSSKFCITLLCVLPFLFIKKILYYELYMTALIILFASIATVKQFSKKDAFIFSLLYCLFFFILEKGSFIYNLFHYPESALLIFAYGAQIIKLLEENILIWLILGGFIFFIVNYITVKLLTWSKTEKIFMPLNKFFSNPLKTGILVIITVLFSNLCAFSQGVPITITPIEKLDNIVQTSMYLTLDDERVLLLKGNEQKQILIYNTKKDYVNKHCPILDIPEGYENAGTLGSIKILKLSDGNVFIRSFIKEKENNKNTKTIAYIYSPFENKIIFKEELPKQISFEQIAVVQISEDKLMFIGALENNNYNEAKLTYIYNLKDKTLTKKSNTNKNRRRCSAILLKDGRVFVIGGYHENNETAELYDIKKDEFTEIPTGFIWNSSHIDDDIFIIDDGEVIIKTNAFMKNEEDGIGSYRWSKDFGNGYPVPYIAIFNPEDNSFKKVDLNKSNKEVIDNYYSITVTPNGKIIASGGNYAIKTPLKEGKDTEKWRKENPNFTKYNWKLGESVNKLIFYDIKTGKKKYSYGETIPPLKEPEIVALNNNEIIIKYQGFLGQKYKHYYNKIKF